MATKIDIQDAIIQAYGYAIELGDELYQEQSKGCVDCYDASKIECIIWLTGDLQSRIDNNIYDKDTDALYEQLLELLSGYIGEVEVDINASIPYTVINVVGGVGQAEWGSITGDINLQLDLIARLNLKVNYADLIQFPDDNDFPDFI